MDLSGSVWEWCLNEYSNPERMEPEGSESRVVRGGSWNDGRAGARGLPQLQAPGPPPRLLWFPCGDPVSHPLSRSLENLVPAIVG